MKTQRNILIAFLLNLSFSVFEFFGGLFTGSVAILSDSVHDLGDAASIGISYLLEKKSRKQPDDTYTYGYGRFSVLGGLITTVILTVGSLLVIISAVRRLFQPTDIHYDSMIVFAVVGTVLNLIAAFVTWEGDSINQKSVNLHMLEDVLGWIVVLIGAIVMRFTDIRRIDPLMSIGVSVFILVHTLENYAEIGALFLEKAPEQIRIRELKAALEMLEGVSEVHHIHVRSLDGSRHAATMHILLSDGQNPDIIKTRVRTCLSDYGIVHSVLETETSHCGKADCEIGREP